MIAALVRFLPLCIILLSCFCTHGLAQTPNASAAVSTLSGTVKDASGVAVPFAKITAKNSATGAASQAQADSTGAFSIANLAPGDYEVTATAEGFIAAAITMTLAAGSPQTLSLALTSVANGPSLSDLGFSPAQTQGNAADQARLDKRSHMLRTHQRLGLITTVPLLTTVILGFNAGGRQESSTTRDVHAALGSATVGFYGATAYYAIFAPKIHGTETRGPIRAHKILAWIHGPGLVLTPILGEMAFAQRSRGEKPHGLAALHDPVAVITASAYGAAILSVSLKW